VGTPAVPASIATVDTYTSGVAVMDAEERRGRISSLRAVRWARRWLLTGVRLLITRLRFRTEAFGGVRVTWKFSAGYFGNGELWMCFPLI